MAPEYAYINVFFLQAAVFVSIMSARPTQQTQNACITFIQRRPNVFV